MTTFADQTGEVTDIHSYLTNNPAFRKCRAERHHWQDLDEGWVECPGDSRATHEKKSRCPRCGMVKRKRAVIVLRRYRGRVRISRFTKLEPYYLDADAKGYHLKGVGRGALPSAVVDEYEATLQFEGNGRFL